MAYGRPKRRVMAKRRTKRFKRSVRRKLTRASGSGSAAYHVAAPNIARAAGYTGMYNTVGSLVRSAGASTSTGRRGMKRCRWPEGRDKEDGTGSYAQWTQDYKQGKFGTLTAKKIDKMSTERIIFTHRLMGPFNDYGQFFLTNYQDGAGFQQYPLVMFELNSAPNVINGTYTPQNPVYRMYQTGTSIAWNNITGQNPDGT